MTAIRLPLATLAALALVCNLASSARADTAFGGDPSQAINTTLTCATGAPTGFEFPPIFIGTAGQPSCMWAWSNPAVGSDIVPFPATGGSGTITSVTLPAMPNPGPMQVVVLTAALNATTDPGDPDYICCQVKQVGPTFTVLPNQVATVAQDLHVSATEAADLNVPGDTSFGDLLGISIESPTASLPVRYTGNVSLTNFDGDSVYYPAPSGANGEFDTPLDPVGFQLLARFTLALDAAGGGAVGAAGGGGPVGAGGGGAEPAAGGVRLGPKSLELGADGKTLTVGRATNPPTARTTQTLTALPAGRVAASAAKKPTVYGSSKTKVPAGKTVGLKLELNANAKRALKRLHKLKAMLTLVAKNDEGEAQTVTRTVTIRASNGKRAK
jgi:hypothetical protein